MSDKLKWIISIVMIAIVCIVGIGLVFGYKITKNSKDAEQATQEFVQCLLDGKLSSARAAYYFIPENDTTVPESDTEMSSVQYISEQELAMFYGEEMVMEGREDILDPEERLFALVMRYSTITSKTGIVMNTDGRATFVLTGPDLLSWSDNLSIEEINEMAQAEDVVSWIEMQLESGDIPQRSVQFIVPMKKIYGNWRFDITDEMESALFGGI